MSARIWTPEEIAACNARIGTAWRERNGELVHSIVRWNDNKQSRRHLKTLVDTAPAWNAPQRDWEAWVFDQFPGLKERLIDWRGQQKLESELRSKAFEIDRNRRYAEGGKRYGYDGKVFDNALAFVTFLLSDSWIVERRSGGVCRFTRVIKDAPFTGSVALLGPWRDARINAALDYLGTVKQASDACKDVLKTA